MADETLTLRLPPQLLRRIDEKIADGTYPSRAAAIHQVLDRWIDRGADDSFEDEDLDRFLAVGLADMASGRVVEIEEVRRRLAEARTSAIPGGE